MSFERNRLIRVGVAAREYNSDRNIVDFPRQNSTVRQNFDVFRLLNHLIYRISGRSNHCMSNMYFDGNLGFCDVNHFFNKISFSNRPWITTFETSLPRGMKNRILCDYAVRRLEHKSCVKLIALSECAAKIQRGFLCENYKYWEECVMDKVVVMHPPQKVIVEKKQHFNSIGRPLNFVLIGCNLFMKGGREVLLVFDKLFRQNKNIKLTIVGRLSYPNYTEAQRNELRSVINAHPRQISWYEQLPNREVLELFKNANVGLLPTWADTYGYTVLEAQACGCPVITTDIGALPEINNDKCGWLIKVPKNKYGYGVIGNEHERKIFSQCISEQLTAVIGSIVSNPSVVIEKGKKAVEMIQTMHSPINHGNKLEILYRKALGLESL